MEREYTLKKKSPLHIWRLHSWSRRLSLKAHKTEGPKRNRLDKIERNRSILHVCTESKSLYRVFFKGTTYSACFVAASMVAGIKQVHYTHFLPTKKIFSKSFGSSALYIGESTLTLPQRLFNKTPHGNPLPIYAITHWIFFTSPSRI